MKQWPPFALMTGVSLYAIFTYLGIYFSIDKLKYLAVGILACVSFYSIYTIAKNTEKINWTLASTILLLLCFYPLARILYDSVVPFDTKKITDGLIIYGSYYQLLIVGLALAVCTVSLKFDLKHILLRYGYYFLVPGIIFSIYNVTHLHTGVAFSYLAFDNCFIPGALLALILTPRRYLLLGIVSVCSIAVVSAVIASRSYLLLSIYLTLAILARVYRANKGILFVIITSGILVYFLGGFSTATENQYLLHPSRSIVDKFAFDTLSDRFSLFWEEYDFSTLYYWEGNSRAGILIDAFQPFDLLDWLYGKGVFGTYHSFVVRSTIELGWAQETFRWGILYSLCQFTLFIVAIVTLQKPSFDSVRDICSILQVIVIVKLLDSFIYGVPITSVYNLFAFWGQMMICVHPTTRETTVPEVQYRPEGYADGFVHNR